MDDAYFDAVNDAEWEKCFWCGGPVKEGGDACNLSCYKSWVIAVTLSNGKVNEDEIIPKDLTEQPWYEPMIGRDRSES